MMCKKRKGLDLRRGIAIFLLLLMGCTGAGMVSGTEAFAASSLSAKVSYTKLINYEGTCTHDYKVTVKGDKVVAYCTEPTKERLLKNTFTAKPNNNALMNKLLYYSYGYPGFSSKTKDYLAGVSRKSCYKNSSGNYALFHVLLSYAYDSKSSDTDAFVGVSSDSKSMMKKVLTKIESWPAPLRDASISLSKTVVTAAYDESSDMQVTPKIKLKGNAANSIKVAVPQDTILVRVNASGTEKDYDSESVSSVTVNGGESFYFRAPKDKEGTYQSSGMKGTAKAFQAYMIRKDGKQNLIFAVNEESNSVAFKINWSPSADADLSTSASEKETGAKEIDPDGQVTIVDEVNYEGLEPGKEYTIRGRMMDKSTEDEITGVTGETTFTPEASSGTAIVEFVIDSEQLAGRSLVAFEDLYCGETLISSHEDINDEAQTVTLTGEPVPLPGGDTEEPTESEQPTEDEQQMEVEDEQTTAESEQPTEADQPTEAESEQPTAESEQPTAESEQPTAESEQPTAESEQPTEAEQPTTEANHLTPVAEIEQPTTQSVSPSKPAKTAAVSGESAGVSPMTGDEKHLVFAFVLMAAALLAAGCTLVFRKSLR